MKFFPDGPVINKVKLFTIFIRKCQSLLKFYNFSITISPLHIPVAEKVLLFCLARTEVYLLSFEFLGK